MSQHRMKSAPEPVTATAGTQQRPESSRSPASQGWTKFRRWSLWGLVLAAVLFGGDRIIRSRHRAYVLSVSRECDLLSRENRWDELAKVAERWSQVEPYRAEPWLFRAEVAENTQDWENLIQFLDRVPRSDRRAVGALVRKAAAEFEYLNRPWEGMKTCDEVLAIDPRVLLAHKQVVFFNVMTLQRSELVRRIRQAIRVRRESPWTYAYLASSSWIYSSSLYQQNSRWLENDPTNETFLVAQALHVYTAEVKSDLEIAHEFDDIPSAEDMLQRYPQNLELVAYFLNQSMTAGDVDRVQQLLEMIPRDRTEGDARFWRARGWVEDTLGEFEVAEQSLRKAFELDPYWWRIHFQLHDLLRRRGKIEESEKFMKIYKASWDLTLEIISSNKPVDTLDEKKICRLMLNLVELIGDDEVASVLRDRVSIL